ncbi:MAG: hypothetical protein GF363_08805, partial [Chitinivibrionales bacterium]|nr:hypothetical protein [Chitinivibrionales bacterium]
MQVQSADTVTLAVRERILLKMLGDTTLGGWGQGSYAVDVVALETDRMGFFWAAGGTSGDAVLRTDYLLGSAKASAEQPLELKDNLTNPVTYLHARGNAQDYLVVFTDDKYKGGLFACRDGMAPLEITRLINGPYDALAKEDSNTYLVTHRLDNDRLILRRISSAASSLTETAAHISIINGTAMDIVTNSSVAVDTPGTIVILSLRGGAFNPKRLEYKAMTSSFATVDSGVLAENVSDPGGFTFYEDAPIVSYAATKFAAAHWTEDGVYLDTITHVGPGRVETEAIKVVDGTGFRSATVAAGGGYLLVAWKGNLTGNSSRSVEGFRYRIHEG